MRAVFFALACALALPAEAQEAENFLGGRVVARRVGWFTAGFPDVEGGVRFPQGAWDVAVRLRVAYGGGGFSGTPNAVSLLPGVHVRWQLLTSGALTGTLTASIHVGAALGDGEEALGIGLLHPGWLLSYRVGALVDVTVGLVVQPDLWVQGGGAYLWLATPIVAGVELRASTRLQVGLRLEAGPSFLFGDTSAIGAPRPPPGAIVSGRIRAVAGLGVAF